MVSRVSVTITYHRSIDQSLELWTSPFISYCTLVLIWLVSTAERVSSAARKATSYFTKARVTAQCSGLFLYQLHGTASINVGCRQVVKNSLYFLKQNDDATVHKRSPCLPCICMCVFVCVFVCVCVCVCIYTYTQTHTHTHTHTKVKVNLN